MCGFRELSFIRVVIKQNVKRHIRETQHRMVQQSRDSVIHIHISAVLTLIVVMVCTSFKFLNILYHTKTDLSNTI